MRVIICSLSAACALAVCSDLRAQDHEDTIGRGRYVTGGIVGSVIGLGIGHAINGTYGKRGWIFTASEVASLGLLVGGLAVTLTKSGVAEAPYGSGEEHYSTVDPAGPVMFIAGAVAYGALRVWEAVDLWVSPEVVSRERVARPRRRRSSSRVALAPVVSSHVYGLGAKLTF